MNKKFIIPLAALLFVGVVSAIGYMMLTVTSHINVVESQELYYYNGAQFVKFHNNSLGLDEANMAAGSSNPFFVRAKNSANRPVMYTLTVTNNDSVLKFGVTCNDALESTGTKYKVVSGNTFGEGLVLLVLNEGGKNATLGIDTIVDAGATPTTLAEQKKPITTVERSEVDSSIVWDSC